MNLDLLHTQPQPEAAAMHASNLLWSLDILPNPEGIVSFSPGLRGTSYPGFQHRKTLQPCKGCITVPTDAFWPPCHWITDPADEERSNPFRVDASSYHTPRVARASQPWAERSRPFRMTAKETRATCSPRL
jgi:hypothetical protein